MDESPTMRELWHCAMHSSRRGRPQNEVHRARCFASGKSSEKLRFLSEYLEFGRHNVATAVQSFVQDFGKAQSTQPFPQDNSNPLTHQAPFLAIAKSFECLLSISRKLWDQPVGASSCLSLSTATVLASTSTAVLATVPSSDSRLSHGFVEDSHSTSAQNHTWTNLKARRLKNANSQMARPTWVKEPSEATLALAEEIAENSVEGWSGFIRPVDKLWQLSSDFGPRWGRHHDGVDLAAPAGEPILAADSGLVTFAGWEPGGYGYLVEITHQDGWKTLYAHSNEIFTWEGQFVTRGDCIASVGETGRASGPHLHWEIRNKHGKPLNPSDHVIL